MTISVDDIAKTLAERGLLLFQDKLFPNVVALVVDEPVAGSWWGHPRGGEIYDLARQLAEHPDVLALKLLSKKETLVDRRLWPALAAVAMAREPWQLAGLSPRAGALLERVEANGEVLESGALPRELEYRLLALGRGVHTERGHHAKQLVSWSAWLNEQSGVRTDLSVCEARERLDQLVTTLNRESGASARLPWWPSGRASR